jgi:hypothetical protein
MLSKHCKFNIQDVGVRLYNDKGSNSVRGTRYLLVWDLLCTVEEVGKYTRK